MKCGLPTCRDPIDPTAFYFRCMYHTLFWGPFTDERELTDAINHLDRTEAWWDYDCFDIIHGATPLPKDYVGGFPSVPRELRDRIEAQRIDPKLRPQPAEF